MKFSVFEKQTWKQAILLPRHRANDGGDVSNIDHPVLVHVATASASFAINADDILTLSIAVAPYKRGRGAVGILIASGGCIDCEQKLVEERNAVALARTHIVALDSPDAVRSLGCTIEIQFAVGIVDDRHGALGRPAARPR